MPSLAELPDLTGFFSYSRRDDEHSQGSLSRLRAQIFNELRLQLGLNFKLWQDTVAIPEGTEWEGEIKRAICESVFFIPIVTPSSVASTYCRMEFEAFLEREAALGRKNLVFPLLYVRVPALEKEELWRQDPLLSIIGRRQYFDWQRFRHRSFTEGEIAEKIEQFCRNIVESLQQPWISPADRRAAEEAEARRMADKARRDQAEKERQQAERRQNAEQDRRAAEQAEAQRIADQIRRRAEGEGQRQQADIEVPRKEIDQPRQESVTPPQATEESRTGSRAVGWVVAALCGSALLYYLVSVLKPASAPNTSVAALNATPYNVGCSSFSPTHSPAGKVAAIVADDSAAAKFAMHSAQATAVQNGYSIFTYVRSGLNAADVSPLLWQLQAVDLIIVCGPPDSAFARALSASNIIK
ncbi:MAG: hypothetical protein QOJ86_3881 [Bradyrhizobium sp.]|jgi:hypothetical protein|nr:hypothetical protein [Bradyrhizobium sp.]